jgi:hypothetical protein
MTTSVLRLRAGKDFDTLTSEVRARLRQKYPTLSLDFTNDLLRVLVDFNALSIENLNFFLDLAVNENFVTTARRLSSLADLAAFAAYAPRGAVPCAGEVSLRPDRDYQLFLTLPVGQRFTGANGLTYEVSAPVVWSVGDTSFKTVSLREGVSVSRTFRSDGRRLQRIPLTGLEPGEFIAWHDVAVTVDGVPWEEVDLFQEDAGEQFRVNYLAAPPTVEFGDGAVGTVPPTDAEILIEYRVHHGRAGFIPVQTAGAIRGVEGSWVVSGTPINVVIDVTTGQMSGGAGPQSAAELRAAIPPAHHSDGAVVTPQDVQGVLQTYRHPQHGAVAAANAFVARSIQNDLTSYNTIRAIRAAFEDGDVKIAAYQAALTATFTALEGSFGDIRATQADLEVQRGLLDDVAVDLGTVQTNIATEINAGGVAADIAQARITSAQTQRAALASAISAIPSGGADQLTGGTKLALLDLTSQIDTLLTSASGSLTAQGNNLQELQTQLAQIVSQIQAIEAISDTVQGLDADLLTTATAGEATITSGEAALTAFVADLTDPWDVVVGLVNTLETHLDGILSDECGPNVVSVPIVTFDSDGFYVAPPVGLQRAFEAYIRERCEPSVIFRVVDGSQNLIRPALRLTFELLPGFSALQIKAGLEAALLNNLRGRLFGEDVVLDDLYEACTVVPGIAKLEVRITGFAGGQVGDASIRDGHLLVEQRALVTRPTATYFLRRPEDGSLEAI